MCSHLLSGRPHWSLRSEWHCQVPSAQGLAGSGWKISALDPLGQGCHRGPVIRSTEPRGRKHEPRLGMGEGGHRRRAGRACCRRLVLEGGEQVGSWVHRVGGSGELWLTKDEAPVSISCCICLWDLPDGFTEGDSQGGSCSFPQESTACRRTREKSPLSPGFGKAPPGRQLWSLQRISLPGPRGSKVPQTEWPKTNGFAKNIYSLTNLNAEVHGQGVGGASLPPEALGRSLALLPIASLQPRVLLGLRPCTILHFHSLLPLHAGSCPLGRTLILGFRAYPGGPG